MKRLIALAIIAFFGWSAAKAADSTTSETQQTIVVKATKASKGLTEAWAKAYMETHKDVNIVVTTKKAERADLSYINDKAEGQEVTYVGRYAILPITSSDNPLINELKQKSWNKNDLKKLYFSSLDEDLDEDDETVRGKAGKLREKLTVYSGANASSIAGIFADYFGFQTAELRGNKISGDDLYLLNAIAEDKQSITFNQVAYLYDTATRHLKQGITILPIKVSNEVEEALKEGNLDATLKVLEDENSDLIPVGSFGFAYQHLNIQAQLFLEWIVNEGQDYNNTNGFLRLAKKDAQRETQNLAKR